MSKKLDEIITEIRETEKCLLKLEDAYEIEEDERKTVVLDNRITRTEKKLDKLIDKADALREKEGNKLEEKEEEVDDSVCPVCGSDLLEVEDGVYLCEKCQEYYTEESA